MIRLLSFFLLVLTFTSCNSLKFGATNKNMPAFDWQGHRGARGLLPENTTPAMLKALEYPVTTLELDVVITKDRQVILSHEPWMSSTICNKVDGTAVEKEEAQSLKVYEMSYQEIQSYDCGSRGNLRFKEQQKMPTTKVRLSEIVQAVEAHVKTERLSRPYYNIEIKSRPEWDDVYTPKPDVFAELLLAEIKNLGISRRTTIQSFDPRALQATKKQAPKMSLALLVENQNGIEKNLASLGFTPYIYSPLHLLLNKEEVEQLHQKGMKVIPWTVNEVPRMKALIEMGVDGIITDYPNLISEIKE